MIKVEVHNCNNITSANIHIRKNNLNIRYAMNGAGKSTIAVAIERKSKNESLSSLQEFGSEIVPTCLLTEECDKVLLFNEHYVENIIFQESEVIPNSFEVFIKTPQYEEKQASIDEKLKNIHVDVSQNEDLQKIVSVGRIVREKFPVTASGVLREGGVFKSLVQSSSPYELPKELARFQPLMEKDYTVNWVGWKHEGSKYDGNDICPFCTLDLDAEYKNQKKTFTESYAKSDVKNRIEMLSYFHSIEEFMEESAKDKLHKCIQGLQNEDETKLWVSKFYFELDFLLNGITRLEEFNSDRVRRDDISKLDEQLTQLTIDMSNLKIFNNKRVEDSIESVNQRIKDLQRETESLKSEIGELTSLLFSACKNTVADINVFLFTAGINYSFDIIPEYEGVSKTILKYNSKTNDPVEVKDIKVHLSWGERNAFALVLFMHEALSKKPDLIILDDPISSFDSNKKYAIISRLFSSKRASFNEKTVLMLTHDLQPIIDFIKVNKPKGVSVSAYYLQNKSGVISEQEISDVDIKSFPKLLEAESKNKELNIVHRVASLRKLLEYTPNDDKALEYARITLSCLLHGESEPERLNGTKLTNAEVESVEKIIEDYITDFSYSDYLTKVFTKDSLLESFKEEKNTYVRLQVFRVLVGVLGLRTRIDDDPLLKYIDEQFHVENDYMFGLDLMKYDIVPDFVIPKCIEFLKKERLIS